VKIVTSLIVIFCIVSITGCKKPLFDYRKKYLGDFSFSIHEESHIGGTSTDTTYTMDGTISKGSDLQSIRITYSSGMSEEFILFEDGSIRLYNGYGSSSTGEFESVNQMQYTNSWEHMVFYGSKSVTGTRK
jgi:hypothetical protein